MDRNIKNWQKFNELFQNTYYNAASKAGYDSERGQKLSKHAVSKGLYKNNPFIGKLVFNIFTTITIDRDGEEIFPNRVIKYKISDGLEVHDENFAQFCINSIDEEEPLGGYIIISFDDNDNGKLKLGLGSYLKDPYNKYSGRVFNLFADRKSARDFMKMLHTMYIMDDPNTSAGAVAKINKTKITKINHTEVEDGSNFWKYLQQNGYDWEKFKSSINVNKLWDDLMPKKINPQWKSNNTWEN